MNKLFYTFLFCAGMFCIYTIAMLTDAIAFNFRYHNKLTYKPDCAYSIPNGYKVVYCEDISKYAVRVMSYNDYFLYNQLSRITPIYSTIAMPALFDDSCEAKGYLKGYIKQTEPRIHCAE